ncbi:hypothetical protein ALC53_14042, partial [Atta colombica]
LNAARSEFNKQVSEMKSIDDAHSAIQRDYWQFGRRFTMLKGARQRCLSKEVSINREDGKTDLFRQRRRGEEARIRGSETVGFQRALTVKVEKEISIESEIILQSDVLLLRIIKFITQNLCGTNDISKILYSFALRKHVCQLACKNCHEILTSGLILLWSISRGAHIPPPKPLENGCPMVEMFIPRTREIWNAATCSTYVNCSAKQAVPLAFRSTPLRFTPRLHYTISNKPEYCILRSCVFRSSDFSSARVQWNVRIKRKIIAQIVFLFQTCIVKSIITFKDYVSIIHMIRFTKIKYYFYSLKKYRISLSRCYELSFCNKAYVASDISAYTTYRLRVEEPHPL